jgi:hypothetical protein
MVTATSEKSDLVFEMIFVEIFEYRYRPRIVIKTINVT